MTQDVYIHEIQRKTGFSRATNKRVGADLAGDIAARQEVGAALPDILQDMGTPDEVAASLRESMPGEVLPKKSAWRWVFLALAIGMAGCLVYLAVWRPVYTSPPAPAAHGQGLTVVTTSDGQGVTVVTASDGQVMIADQTMTFTIMTDGPQVAKGVHVGMGEVLGLGLGSLGVFLLMSWVGRGRWRHLALAAGLFVLAALLLAGGLSGSMLEGVILEGSTGMLMLSRVLNPAFLLPLVCGILALRAGLRKTALQQP